jgi:dGTPase
LNPRIKQYSKTIQQLFEILFSQYFEDLERRNHESQIFVGFLMDKSDEYVQSHHPAEVVRDFIAGMTDRYFLDQCPDNLRPSIERA